MSAALAIEAAGDDCGAALADQCDYEQTLIDDALGPGWQDRLVVFGAGTIGRDALRGLRRIGIEPRAFADNAMALHDVTVDGLRVVAPNDIRSVIEDPCVVVAVWRSKPVLAQLASAGIGRAVSFKALFWHRPDAFLPYMRMDRPSELLRASVQIARVANALSDERSRAEYARQLSWLGAFDAGPLERDASEEQYFAFDLFSPRAGEVFVDCGAFDGDTVKRVLAQWPDDVTVHALEPDPANCATLEGWRERLPEATARRVRVYRCASASRRGSLRFSSAGAGSSATSDGELLVDGVPLDELFASERVTFVKMDIEGAEVDALDGAIELLRRDRPIVAACLYHRQSHLWEVPLRLIDAVPSYRLHIRRYGDEYGDVVCYAVPSERAPR